MARVCIHHVCIKKERSERERCFCSYLMICRARSSQLISAAVCHVRLQHQYISWNEKSVCSQRAIMVEAGLVLLCERRMKLLPVARVLLKDFMVVSCRFIKKLISKNNFCIKVRIVLFIFFCARKELNFGMECVIHFSSFFLLVQFWLTNIMRVT